MATTELLKKVLYTGVGVVTTTTGKVTETVKGSMEGFSKLTETAEEKGKEVVDGVYGDVKETTGDVSDRFKKIIDKVLSQFDLPNRTEAENLNAKIAELEEKLAAKKKTVRKTTRKATTTARKTATKVTAKAKEVIEDVKAEIKK